MDYEGFIQETEPDLPDNDNGSFERSKVFLVSRLENVAWESVLYVREHLVDLEKKIMKEFWNNPNKSILYVNGSPGSGKTCFFYLWARLRSFHENKRVLIVQVRELESSFIWIREANGVLWRRNKHIECSKLEDEVDTILDKKDATPFDLCIHDGVVEGATRGNIMLSTFNVAVGNDIIKKVVHVASLPFSLSTGGQDLSARGPILELSVDSWRLQDYIEAINCQYFAARMASMLRGDKKALLETNRDDDGGTKQNSTTDDASDDKIGTVSNEDKETSNEAVVEDDVVSDMVVSGDDGDTSDDDVAAWTDVIETKFYYAGGSARFMFDFQLSELRRWLDYFCSKVDSTHFAHSRVTPHTPVAVNELMQQFEGNASPISKYILFRAYENCKTKLVNAMKEKAANHSSNNPALTGWAFELAQIDLLRLSLASPPERPDYITNKTGLTFRPHSAIDFDEKKLLSNGDVQADGTIIWCQKWNQGCFDVAFYKETTLFTLQLTVSKEHYSWNPKFIRMLRDALLKKGVHVNAAVHVVVGEAKDEEFQFNTDTSGTGRQGCNAKGAPEFTINVYHSPPLEKTTVKPTVVFQAELSHFLGNVDMWEQATTNKRCKRL